MRGRAIPALSILGRAKSSAFLKPSVDQIRKWDLLPSLCLASLVLLGVLFYVWQHIQVVRMGYEIEHLQAERLSLVRQESELRFEVARLRSLRRVEEVARRQLGLTSPMSGQVVIAE
jgi:cell division protein FtsL